MSHLNFTDKRNVPFCNNCQTSRTLIGQELSSEYIADHATLRLNGFICFRVAFVHDIFMPFGSPLLPICRGS